MWARIKGALTWLAKSDSGWATFLRVFLGVAAGVLTVFLANLGMSHPWRQVISELGVAVILASVAVFAIELRAHNRLIRRIVSELTETMHNEHEKLVSISQAHFEKLAAMVQRSAHDALPGVLHEVFKNFDPRLHENTVAMINAFEKMEATKTWTDRVAMRFVGELFQFVSDNATSLQQANQSGGAYDIILPPSSRQLADIILAGQMDELEAGDSYIVVSDLASWRDGLGLFFEATVKALGKGVKVRRLICPWDYDSRLAQQDIDDILERHWDDAIFERWRDGTGVPLYELGIITRRAVMERSYHNISHVGVFHHKSETACFEPKHSDLSRMEFSRKDKLDKALLETLWRKAHTNYKIEHDGVRIIQRREVVPLLGADWWK